MTAGGCAKPSSSSRGRSEPAGSRLASRSQRTPISLSLFSLPSPPRPPLLTGPCGFIVPPSAVSGRAGSSTGPHTLPCQGAVARRAPCPESGSGSPSTPPSLAPVPPAIASWPPLRLLSSGALCAEPPLPARCWGLLPGCWQGPHGGERGARLHPCSVSSQGRAIVPGWEEGVRFGLLSIYTLMPHVHPK